MNTGKGSLCGICTSLKRGTAKIQVEQAELVENWGIRGDAHAGDWHRQISILPVEKINEFNRRGAGVSFGSFGENLIVEGIDPQLFQIGTCFAVGESILEITQIGKQCHHHCAIYKKMGECIMPRDGVFAKVRKGGVIRSGDEVRMVSDETEVSDGCDSEQRKNGGRTDVSEHREKFSVSAEEKTVPFSCAVVTVSDRGFSGQRDDESGACIVRRLENEGYRICERIIVPDDQKRISAELIRLADEAGADLIITTGGTGFSPRDVTPEATLEVATRNVPGIAEVIRAESFKITRRAMLSRAVSVIRNRTLIINLPGSARAVDECLDIILDELYHGLNILLQRDGECGRG
jgi:molybdenum cofactor synthesis domain-containing protein